MLQLCWLIAVAALWKRRWRGSRTGSIGLIFALGLGLMAKLTFALSLAALFLTALLCRKDKSTLNPPDRVQLWKISTILLLCTSPLWISWLHQYSMPRVVHSHDFWSMQSERSWKALLGGSSPVREQWSNLGIWLFQPLEFFTQVYKAESAQSWWWLRLIGMLLCLPGTFLVWKEK